LGTTEPEGVATEEGGAEGDGDSCPRSLARSLARRSSSSPPRAPPPPNDDASCPSPPPSSTAPPLLSALPPSSPRAGGGAVPCCSSGEQVSPKSEGVRMPSGGLGGRLRLDWPGSPKWLFDLAFSTISSNCFPLLLLSVAVISLGFLLLTVCSRIATLSSTNPDSETCSPTDSDLSPWSSSI